MIDSADSPSPRLDTLPVLLDVDATTISATTSVDVLGMLFAGLGDLSREGYTRDLNALAIFLGLSSPSEAAGRLLGLTRGQANATSAAWTADMLARGLSPSTVRRRFAALARVYSAGRRFDLTEVTPEAILPRTEALRDTTGPGKRGWDTILAQAVAEAGRDDGPDTRPDGRRNLAILLLLHDRGLRRGELSALDLPEDFDAGRPAVYVMGKGRREKVWLTVSERAGRAVSAWLDDRGREAGPLFVRLDRAASSDPIERLSGQSVNEMVKAVADRADVRRTVRAHGLRHQAITETLDQGWSVRDTMAFSRHVDPRTVMLYDDRRADKGGEISESIASEKRPRRRRR